MPPQNPPRPKKKPPEICENCCLCKGYERAAYVHERKIRKYHGDLPSPIPVYSWYPRQEAIAFISDTQIRNLVDRAAAYHGIPKSFLAAILQLENHPGSSLGRQVLQAGERTAQGIANILDHAARKITGYDLDDLPNMRANLDETIRKFARGSTGIANMSDSTLNSAAKYTIKNYCKNPIHAIDRYAIGGIDVDDRIAGLDLYADIYYAAAHVRQIIDETKGTKCYQGELIKEDAEKVLAAYNGSGSGARTYGKRGVQYIENNIARKGWLYFYG